MTDARQRAGRTHGLALIATLAALAIALLGAGSARAAGPVATDVSAGYDHTCAVIEGSVFCWGMNDHGQLGDGSKVDSSLPIEVLFYEPGVTFRKVSAGRYQTCALDNRGVVWCWGDNAYGQIGYVNLDPPYGTEDRLYAKEIAFPFPGPATTIADISVGGQHVCAIDTLGTTWCWGSNVDGRLGIGTSDSDPHPTPVVPSGLDAMPVTFVSAGSSHSCATALDDVLMKFTLKCWGNNDYGQLGVGDRLDRYYPINVNKPVPNNSQPFETASPSVPSAGDEFTCAADDDEKISCWGKSEDRQASSDIADVLDPLKNGLEASTCMSILYDVSCPERVSAGLGSHACIIERRPPSRALCWGSNYEGQLGDGSFGFASAIPRVVDGLAGAAKITTGGHHTCALQSGWIKCVGDNSYGQLGVGDKVPRTYPQEVRSAADVFVDAGFDGMETTDDHVNVTFTTKGHPDPACKLDGRSISSGDAVALQPGVNEFEIRCTNDYSPIAGRDSFTVTRNVGAQISGFSTSTGGVTAAASTTLTWGVSGIPTPSCTVNGVAHVSGESFNLAYGDNSFDLYCSNSAGGESLLMNVHRQTPPVITNAAFNGNGLTEDTQKTITWLVSGEPAPSCDINGTPHVSGDVIALSPGTNTITITCINAAGSASTSLSAYRQTTATITDYRSSQSSPTQATKTTLTWSTSGNPAPSTCKVGGVDYSSGVELPLAIGTNNFILLCNNGIGPGWTSSVTVVRNAAPQILSLSSSVGSETTDAETRLSWTLAAEPAASCKVNGDPHASGDADFALDPGVNTFVVTCDNGVGGAATGLISVTLNVPTQITSAAALSGAQTTDQKTTLNWATSGYPAAATCTVDGVARTSGDHNFALDPGVNSFELSCSNGVGAAATTTIEVTRNVAPGIDSFAAIGGATTTQSRVDLAWTTSGYPTPTCIMGLDVATSPESLEVLPGENAFQVRCSNGVGDEAIAWATVTRNAAPQVVAFESSSGTTTGATATDLTWTTDGYPAATCKVGGAGHESGETFALDPGANTFSLSCANGVGTAAAASITVTRNVAPTLAVVSPADGTTTLDAQTSIAFTASGHPTPECTVNGAVAISPASVELVVGTNTISVVCTSSAGSAVQVVTVTRNVPPAAAGPTEPTGPAASKTPRITKAPKAARVGRSIKLRVSCASACEIEPQLQIGSRTINGAKVVKVKAGKRQVTIRLSKQAVRQIKRALKRNRRTRVALKLRLQSSAGSSGARWVRIR
jgi:alpha-tubulin suppressor-like RCC1 family protein